MINVREATTADFLRMLGMALAMHTESPRYRHIQFSRKRLMASMRHLNATPVARMFIAEREGELLGMLWGAVDHYFFSDEILARDILFFVAIDARGGKTAPLLVEAFEEWGRTFGVSEFCLGISTDHEQRARYARFFEKLGYHTAGSNTIKRA